MDIGTLVNMASKAFIDSKGSGLAGSSLNNNSVGSALMGLLGDDKGNLDLPAIMSRMQDANLGGVLMSWMGTGANETVSSDQITKIFGSENIEKFTDNLGLREDEAMGGLQDAIPKLVDEVTNNDDFLESIGGVSGAMNLASKFF